MPSYFANAVARALSMLASNFKLVLSDATHVQVPAATGAPAIIAVRGLWRFSEVTVGPVAHPGGAAAAYPVFVTAAAQNISQTPDPFTDDTNYAFALQILSPGTTPTIQAGVVDVFEQVGVAHWSGSAITRLDQTMPPAPLHAGAHATGGADPMTPADIGAVATGDAATLQPGDLIVSGAATRAGAVLCDGSAYSRTDPAYAGLFAKIGTFYGVGDGSSTFNVPDYRGRTIVGAGTGTGLSARLRGQSGGEETHKLTLTELASHNHPDSGHGHSDSGHGHSDNGHGHGVNDPGHGHVWGFGLSVYLSGSPGSGLGHYDVGGSGAQFSSTSGAFTGVSVATGYASITTGFASITTGYANPQAAGGNTPHNNLAPFAVANVFVKL